MELLSDCILVSIDFTHGKETGVLIVGRKRLGESVDIINAFQGEEAWELYKKLVTKKEKENK
jgi:hypothetical protein